MWKSILLAQIAIAPLFTTGAKATVLNIPTLALVATVHTQGEYDNSQLSSWNGQPLSPTNHPNLFQDQLSANLKFYVDPHSRKNLFVTVSGVSDTNFGSIFGAPFELVALTGFTFSLRVDHPAPANFSGQWAVPGESLLGPSAGNNVPLDVTPGWDLASVSGMSDRLTYDVQVDNVGDAFTHFPSVFGTTRIYGGGAFEFSFGPNVNLLRDANFKSLRADAYNGFGAYLEAGTLVGAIPTATPAALPLFAAGLGVMGWLGRRRKRKSAVT